MIGIGTIAKAGLVGLDVYGSYDQFKTSRDNGDNVAIAAGKVAVDAALWAVAPEIALAKMAVDIGSAGFEAIKAYGQGAGRANANSMKGVYNRQFGGNFVNTQNAETMRQRGLQAMQHSGYNINSVLGSEARTYYRGL